MSLGGRVTPANADLFPLPRLRAEAGVVEKSLLRRHTPGAQGRGFEVDRITPHLAAAYLHNRPYRPCSARFRVHSPFKSLPKKPVKRKRVTPGA